MRDLWVDNSDCADTDVGFAVNQMQAQISRIVWRNTVWYWLLDRSTVPLEKARIEFMLVAYDLDLGWCQLDHGGSCRQNYIKNWELHGLNLLSSLSWQRLFVMNQVQIKVRLHFWNFTCTKSIVDFFTIEVVPLLRLIIFKDTTNVGISRQQHFYTVLVSKN